MANIKRIQLLSKAEICELYDLPEFNSNEQKLYFALTAEEFLALNNYTNIKTRVYFILQLGYFKAKQRFFDFKFENVFADVNYILSSFSTPQTHVLMLVVNPD